MSVNENKLTLTYTSLSGKEVTGNVIETYGDCLVVKITSPPEFKGEEAFIKTFKTK